LVLALCPVVAQGQEPDPLAQARALVRQGHLDSAAVLLGRVTGAAASSDTARRAEAFVLLAVVRYYQGNDSATTAAFREALSLRPTLEVSGLAQMDSALGALFEAERLRRATPRENRDTIYSCTPRCLGLDVEPKVKTLEGRVPRRQVASVLGDRTRGTALLRATLDTLGWVERGSVEIVRSTLSPEILNQLVEIFREARYSPGIVRGRPVRVRIERRIDFR
jgi:hypothetical protein